MMATRSMPWSAAISRWTGHASSRPSAALLLLVVALGGLPVGGAATELVRYVKPTGDVHLEGSYPVDLLRLALAKSGRRFDLQPSSEPIPQARAILLLSEGTALDVLWTVTSPERERLLLPVRIPIDRGLYGWRLLLIHESAQARFDEVRTLADLAALRGAQGHDWPDLAILREAGLRVAAGTSYDGLFHMLALGRVDYFPRALPEIWAELRQRPRQPLRIEQGIALHYPSAMYFFVSPGKPDLARALADGLQQALADGSFDALFQQYFSAAIEGAGLSQRRIFEIRNPLLPQLDTETDPRLWFSPAQVR